MIAITLQGRLGNQLFEYAFVYAVSKKLGTSFYIDQSVERSTVDKYFKPLDSRKKNIIGSLFLIDGYKNLFSFYLRKFYYNNSPILKNLAIDKYAWNETPVSIRDWTLYQGFFQSEQFFYDAKDLIKANFIIKENFTEEFNRKFGELYRGQTIIAVHIRQTDYKNLQHTQLGSEDITLPIRYYKKIIAGYNGKNVHFIFVSDDVTFVTDNFSDIPNKTISGDTEIIDLQHLMNADVCVISNSSYGWWGAWLNSKKDKIVYCPKYYMGYHLKKEIPDNIYPADWIQVDYDYC
jgi:hypothetical protein